MSFNTLFHFFLLDEKKVSKKESSPAESSYHIITSKKFIPARLKVLGHGCNDGFDWLGYQSLYLLIEVRQRADMWAPTPRFLPRSSIMLRM